MGQLHHQAAQGSALRCDSSSNLRRLGACFSRLAQGHGQFFLGLIIVQPSVVIFDHGLDAHRPGQIGKLAKNAARLFRCKSTHN